ncbi:MAG: hypothetical protein E3J72_03410 [Planctomycetota bacterium]|nr:MAG: hypothetical protein E3J72_03410 [Planctomycetota bacterium]
MICVRKTGGEVSTRLIVVLTIVGVLIVAAVPLGFYVYPSIKQLFAKPEQLEIIFEEDFESGELATEWKSWNRNQISIDGKIKRGGNYSCRMSGGMGSMGSSGIRRSCDSRLPVVIEFDCYNGIEPFNRNAHDGKGIVVLFQTGGGSHYWLFSFHKPGSIALGWVPDKKVEWKAGRWYHVRLKIELVEKKLFVNGDVSGRSYKKELSNAYDWMKKWENVDFSFSCGTGTAYFDNIRIYQAVKDD